MKITDFLFPVEKLDPERVTDQIKLTYNDFSRGPLSVGRKQQSLYAAVILLGLFGWLSWAILHTSNISMQYMILYLFPLILNALFTAVFIFRNGKNKTAGGLIAIPPLMLFTMLGGFFLISEAGMLQSSAFAAAYYGLIVFCMICIIFMYRMNYRKFPEIAYKNSSKKKSEKWPSVLSAHFIGIFLARNIPLGILGIAALMFVIYMCHIEAFMIILTRYHPQVLEIGQQRGYDR